jgi:uncharacterized protein (TIGR02001 family)
LSRAPTIVGGIEEGNEMKKILLTAAAACAVAAPAMAEEAAGWSFSGNVALTSDYVFRGVTQTLENPAVQGGFDAAYGSFYTGVWASSLDFGYEAPLEVDVYAGFKPTLGPVAADIGVVGYFYPGADDALGVPAGTEFENDYVELYAKGAITPVEPLTLGAAFYYSPEFFAEAGDAYYVEANAAYVLTPSLTASGAVGFQDVEAGFLGGDDNYTTWNLGATYSVAGFGFDVRYSDTTLDDTFYNDIADERFYVTLKRAL